MFIWNVRKSLSWIPRGSLCIRRAHGFWNDEQTGIVETTEDDGREILTLTKLCMRLDQDHRSRLHPEQASVVKMATGLRLQSLGREYLPHQHGSSREEVEEHWCGSRCKNGSLPDGVHAPALLLAWPISPRVLGDVQSEC
jgi:hypothetical protein